MVALYALSRYNYLAAFLLVIIPLIYCLRSASTAVGLHDVLKKKSVDLSDYQFI